MSLVRVAGVDGCRAGWAVVTVGLDGKLAPVFNLAPDFAAVLALTADVATVAVDMPIGLPDRAGIGGRGPEREVRPRLGSRKRSVFSVPSRRAVMEHDYPEACRVAAATSNPSRKVSKQCFNLFPKIRQIDALMTPALEGRIYESHPELAFWRLNGERPMSLPKKVKSRPDPAGLAERRGLLVRHGYTEAFLTMRLPTGVGADDLLDAAVLVLIAARIAKGEAECFPAVPERDEKGLRMAISA